MSKKSGNKKVLSFKKYLVILLIILSILFSGLIYFINVLPMEYFGVFVAIVVIIDLIVSWLLLSNGKVKNLIGGLFSLLLVVAIVFGINYSLNTMDFFKQFGFNEYKSENYNIIVLKTSNYKRIKDLNNKVIGHLDKSKYEGLEKAIDKLNKNISFESKILNDSSELLTSLEEKSIDAIILEDAQLEILKEANDDLYNSIRKLDAIRLKLKMKILVNL